MSCDQWVYKVLSVGMSIMLAVWLHHCNSSTPLDSNSNVHLLLPGGGWRHSEGWGYRKLHRSLAMPYLQCVDEATGYQLCVLPCAPNGTGDHENKWVLYYFLAHPYLGYRLLSKRQLQQLYDQIS
jgi:hypothetical protein